MGQTAYNYLCPQQDRRSSRYIGRIFKNMQKPIVIVSVAISPELADRLDRARAEHQSRSSFIRECVTRGIEDAEAADNAQEL
jgi:predicted DNA-binding protein